MGATPEPIVDKKMKSCEASPNQRRCAWKPGGTSLAPYYEGIFRYPSSLAPFQAPASSTNGRVDINGFSVFLFTPFFVERVDVDGNQKSHSQPPGMHGAW